MGVSFSNNKEKRNRKKDKNELKNKRANNIIINNKMLIKDISEISIIYDINKKDKYVDSDENNINIFGSEFVKNNKNICKMIIDNKEYEITEKYNIKKYNKKIKIFYKLN